MITLSDSAITELRARLAEAEAARETDGYAAAFGALAQAVESLLAKAAASTVADAPQLGRCA